jgi:murein DD-endopeptidase MepM/ murein hydrolase activator NlpD
MLKTLPKHQTVAVNEAYAPVVEFPEQYAVFDFGSGDLDSGMHGEEWGVGKFNEKRLDVYKAFYHGDRDIHLGVDLFGPVGTEVHAFADGEIFLTAINDKPGDYGGTIICKHILHGGRTIYALYGHLGHASLEGKKIGQTIKAGEVIAWMGGREENGGWASHVHFQLSWDAPEACDMPGVASDAQLSTARAAYPDPRLVLGPIF